jgi:hypothetical protein
MCRQCVFEDKKKFGVPYWHVTHQLPGTWICEEHQCSLSESTVKSNGVGRFLWYLPHQSIMREIYSPPSSETTSHVNALTKIARVSRAIASASCEYEMDSARLLKVYLQRLADVWGTMSIAKLLDTVAPPYAEFAQTMRHIPEFSGMPSDSTQAKAQLARLLRTPRSGVHPLRHVLLITFLFEDWEQFWDMYLHSESRDDLSVTNEIAKEPQRQQIADHKAPMRELLKDLLQKKGYAITRAAKQLGIDTTTAMSWAAQMGISTPRRPKMLTEERHNAIIADLGRGESKDVIAKRYGISVQAVTRTLRTEVGLQQIWLDAKYQVAQGLAREKWMLAIRNNPHCGASGIRLLEPAAYAWLYRHNRAWLSQCMVSMPKSLPSNYHKMDWDSRDRCLAQLVQEAVAAIGAEMSVKRRINLQQIYLQVPELRPMLAQLVRLPLTHKAIHIATSSQKLSNMPDLLS